MSSHNIPSACALLLLLSGWLVCANAQTAVQVLGVQYQKDELFPEYNCLWHDRDYPTSCPGTAMGANVHVYLKNTGASAVTINNVTFVGHALNTVLKEDANQHNARSIYFYWDNPPSDILNAGEPVWYKGDPKTIPAGGVAQAVVRLRRPPVTATVAVGVVTSGGTVTTNILIDPTAPQLASVGFSQDRTKVYLHWRRAPLAGSGAAPASVWLNGTNVTALTTTVGDPAMNFAASVIQVPAPLPFMSYHVFQGVFADGKTATASLRAWSHEFIHASWSVFPCNDGDQACAQAWIESATDRGFNAAQNQLSSSGVADFLGTSAGKAYAAARGYGMIVQQLDSWSPVPLLSFLDDETDAEEANLMNNFCGTGLRMPCGSSPMGVLAMREIAEGETFRAKFPNTPTTINMNGTYKPENYYAYGQAVDVLQSDPYYQKRLKDTYWYHYPEWVPLYNKATYIYAVTKACTRAAEPNPYHVILNSTESKETVNGTGLIWPLAPPQCKRIEVYYALAAGSKGISYWWFKPGYPSNGLGDQSRPNAPQLWKEMGLYGNEIKTVSHQLVISHPVDVPLATSTNVWARALAVGTDTLILLVVNDNYWNDQAFHSTDTPNATVTVTLPTWMQPSPTAFEVSAGGLLPVNTQVNGNQMQVNLGTLKITRMVVLTQNAALLSTLQERFHTQCRPGLNNFAPEVCTNVPLSVVQHPANLVLSPGGSGSFTVGAFGTGLKYRWQKNNANLTDGGHYSGATNAVLTVTGADANDAASYRCVVSTAYATNISGAATLSLTTNPPAPPVALPATSVTTNSFTANWNSANEATGYRLDVSTNSGFGTFLGGYQNLDVGNALSRMVGGLTVGTTYYYRVRAVNPNGVSGDSDVISVTLVAPPVCPPAGLVNAGFEGGNTGGVATGWTGYQRAPNPTTVWSIQTTSPPEPASTQYQQIANTSSTGGAGVRQHITGCVVGATYTISGWMRGNSQLYSTCTVKVSATASTSWATAIDLNPPQTYTGSTWTPFSGTVVATSTNMTLWLDGQTGSTGQNKAQCFDSITVTCAGIPVPLRFESVHRPSPNQVSLTVSGPAGVNVTFQSSSNLLNWIPLTNLANPSGTVQFTETMSVNPPRRFYRAISP